MGSSKLIFWFDEIGQDYSDIVGKKSANLGAMKQMRMPIASAVNNLLLDKDSALGLYCSCLI